jgi:hypothetical protein
VVPPSVVPPSVSHVQSVHLLQDSLTVGDGGDEVLLGVGLAGADEVGGAVMDGVGVVLGAWPTTLPIGSGSGNDSFGRPAMALAM